MTEQSRSIIPPIDLAGETLWGADAIANFMGCHPDYVRKSLQEDPDCPVSKKLGKLFALRSELLAWAKYDFPENLK